jgi:putative mRNA 3-end processing factor
LNIEILKEKIRITEDGTIIIGGNISCDGSSIDKPVSVISHAHGDHTKHFESALSYCSHVITSAQTKDLLIAERGSWLRWRRNFIGLSYDDPFDVSQNERVKLFPVKHVLGASQVLVETTAGRVLYTGDFNYPNTNPIKTDILIMEATYGSPEDVRQQSERQLLNQFISLITEEIAQKKPVYVFAHPGKIQCLMSTLTNAGVKIPFICGPKDFQWIEVYRRYGYTIGTVLQQGSPEATEIQKSGSPFISFHRIGSTVPEAKDFLKIRVSAFMAKEDFYELQPNYYVIALSDHADFNGLLEYVRRSEAQLVITDGSRCPKAYTLAREIKERLGIEALALP